MWIRDNFGGLSNSSVLPEEVKCLVLRFPSAGDWAWTAETETPEGVQGVLEEVQWAPDKFCPHTESEMHSGTSGCTL